MKLICIIFVWLGLKGLLDKNMLFLVGKFMIFYIIDVVIEFGMFDKKDIFVSIDLELYREICLECGILVVMRKLEFLID